MKFSKTLLLALFSLTFLIAQAQPNITGQTVFQLGESVKVRLGEGFFEPGPAGENVSWDFSNVSHNQEWDWVAYNPSQTMFKDSFPSATLAFNFPQGDTSSIWEYYQFRNDSLSWLGAASVLSADSTIFYQVMEKDPDVRAAFPFTYQSTFSDNYRGVNWVRFGGMVFEQSRFGNSSDEADAYGTLTTPYGTFNNVVRIRTVEAVYDTLKSFIPVVTRQDIVRYTWYSADERYVLMHMDSIAINQSGFTQITKAHMYRAGEIMTSIDQDKLAEELALTIYPNPASEIINLQFTLKQPQACKISIRNIIGQEMIQLPINVIGSGQQQIPVDISGIGAGYYLLTIETDQGMAAKKIRKI
jgi:hypothetical protein